MPAPTEWFGGAGGEAVELVGSDPAWPRRFAELRARLAAALGPTAERIDHIGSTAVPGIPAKPVIDIQVSVPNLDAEDEYRQPIEALGWPLRAREADHRFFRPPAGEPRNVHVHVCRSGSAWEREHLLFRDYLRHHPDRAAAYAELKARLVASVGDDRPAYTRAKDPFIAETVRMAEGWAQASRWRP